MPARRNPATPNSDRVEFTEHTQQIRGLIDDPVPPRRRQTTSHRALGGWAGLGSSRDPVPLEKRCDVRVLIERSESLKGLVATAFAGWAARTDRYAVLMQGAQHLLAGGVQLGCDFGGGPFPGQVQVPQQHRIQTFAVFPAVRGWTETPAVCSQVRTVSLVVCCCRAICSRVRPSITYHWCRTAWFCPTRGGGGDCGSGRRGIPCRRSAAFTLVVVVPSAAATCRTVIPSSTYSRINDPRLIGSGGALSIQPGRCRTIPAASSAAVTRPRDRPRRRATSATLNPSTTYSCRKVSRAGGGGAFRRSPGSAGWSCPTPGTHAVQHAGIGDP